MLFERPGPSRSKRFGEGWRTVRLATVGREFGGGSDQLRGKLWLLRDKSFVEVNGEDPYVQGEPEIGMCVPAVPMNWP